MDLKKMNLAELHTEEMRKIEGGSIWSWIKEHIFGWVAEVPNDHGEASPAGGVGATFEF